MYIVKLSYYINQSSDRSICHLLLYGNKGSKSRVGCEPISYALEVGHAGPHFDSGISTPAHSWHIVFIK